MTNYIQLLTTASSHDEAQQIATTLVEQRLAACVQIVPQVRSVYRWQGKVEQADEFLCLIKSHQSLVKRVVAEIKRIHSYECPEIIATPIVDGNDKYLRWLGEQLETQLFTD